MKVSKKYGKLCTSQNDKIFRLNLDNCKLIRIFEEKSTEKSKFIQFFLEYSIHALTKIIEENAKFLENIFLLCSLCEQFQRRCFYSNDCKRITQKWCGACNMGLWCGACRVSVWCVCIKQCSFAWDSKVWKTNCAQNIIMIIKITSIWLVDIV